MQRWNDKTLILFDKFARGLQNGNNNPLNNVEFSLCERDENGSVIDARYYRGSYLLVDNGYLSGPPQSIQQSHHFLPRRSYKSE